MGDNIGKSRGDTRGVRCRIALRVVPGSSRDSIVGWMGERLKVKVAAPPEGGRANESVCRLLARALGIGARDVAVVSGEHTPSKVVEVTGIDAARAREILGGV